MLKVSIYKGGKSGSWDSYVNSSPSASAYHLIKWRDVIEKSFGHKTFYLIAEDGGEVKGILPLVLFNSKTFGKFIVSMPFFNYGGICADNQETRNVLLQEAIDIAKQEDVEHIELRHTDKHGLPLEAREKKVEMILMLKDNPEAIWKDLDAKVRNQIRKAEKSDLKAEIKGKEGLDDFYKVFAVNMRDLGTPVYCKKFFENILKQFPDNTKIFAVYLGKKVVAASFTVSFKDSLEVPWAASLRQYRKFCPVMLLYWEMIKHSSLEKYRFFDFGRSSHDSGTYKFKEQWGAKPKQLYWHYWLKDGNKLPEINTDNPKYKLAIKLWQNTPVLITNFVGPHIVKHIP